MQMHNIGWKMGKRVAWGLGEENALHAKHVRVYLLDTDLK